MPAHGFATPRERGGDEVVVVGGDRTVRSSDHAGDTLAPVTCGPQREPRGLRRAVRPALHADGLFVVRTGDAGLDGALAWTLEEYARADADAAVDQSVAGETATDTGIVTVDTDDRVTGIKLNPPDIPLSDGGRFPR